jgi:hypothetical protein
MMGEWQKLNRAELNTPTRETFRGVSVELALSPFDIPEAVRSGWTAEKKIFSFEFKYLGGDESTREIRNSKTPVTLHVGNTSNRLYRVDIDVGGVGSIPELCPRVITQANDAINSQVEVGALRRGSYSAVQKAIKSSTAPA